MRFPRIFLLFVLAAACCVSCRPSGPEHPNFLFLFADDQRADTIGAWGNDHIRTPHLDRLVERGFSFHSNYNMGGNSGAVCVPSRAMVNSGLAYFRLESDLSNASTLPEILGRNGYITFATGKWHNREPSWLRSFQRGKNVFFGGMSDHTKVPLADLSPEGELVNRRVAESFSSEIFADAAVEFLETYDDSAPFYAYVAFTAPHDPRQPPDMYRRMYYESRPPLPANFLPQHSFDLGSSLTLRDERLAAWPRTESVVGDQLAEYYGMITHMDEQIGRVLAALEDSGLAERTVVIYAADHGLAMGSHGLLGKQNLYEHSQKCPLIFAGPGLPEGESEAFTYLLDIFPTVLSLAEVELPERIDGHDLRPIWEKQVESVRDSVFLGYRDTMRAIRRGALKLIRYPQIDHTQLFDLQKDPDEMVDLAAHSGQAETILELTELLLAWQERLGDDQPLVVENPRPKAIDLSGREREPDRWQPEWIVKKYF